MKFIVVTQINQEGNERLILLNRDFIKMLEPITLENHRYPRAARTIVHIAVEDGLRLIKEEISELRQIIEPKDG